jgi:hypothetical protein
VNTFVANAFISPFQHTTALLCFPKNLIPLRDSNPGLLVPEADAMSTAPRYQGNIFISYANKLPYVGWALEVPEQSFASRTGL